MQRVFAAEQYRWVEGRHPLDWLRGVWGRFVEWLDAYGTAHPLAARMLLGVCLVVLLVILAHLATVAWRIYRSTVRAGMAEPGAGVAPPPGAEALAARAEAAARAGRFAEALAHRFTAAILDLDRRKALLFHASKTPAEYLGEANLDPGGRAVLAGLVGTLYHHLFAAAPCDRAAYDAFVLAAEGLARHVAPR